MAIKKSTTRSLLAVCAISLCSASHCAWAATDLLAGSTTGSLTYDGATSELKFAAAFDDHKGERKPIVLVISDQKLPVEKWETNLT
jgi:hypothetical protein